PTSGAAGAGHLTHVDLSVGPGLHSCGRLLQTLFRIPAPPESGPCHATPVRPARRRPPSLSRHPFPAGGGSEPLREPLAKRPGRVHPPPRQGTLLLVRRS